MSNKLPLFELGSIFDKEKINIHFLSRELNENTENAFDYKFRIPEGDIILTEVNGILHQVIYQTQKWFILSRIFKRKKLMKSYLPNGSWKEVVNNNYGITCHSDDGLYYSLYSRIFDFNTFGTMEFQSMRNKR